MIRFTVLFFSMLLAATHPRFADAAEVVKAVTWGCGTLVTGGSFFANAGKMTCSPDPGGEKTEIDSNSGQIICFYNATCTPLTPATRKTLMAIHNERAFKKIGDVMKLSDDETNQAILAGMKVGAFGMKPEISTYAVQCLGTKKEGKPNCPGVNDCINNRGALARFWNLEALNPKMFPSEDDSKGFQLRQRGPGVPEGTSK